jgi:DNA-binding CsgD family transcriptional regulator
MATLDELVSTVESIHAAGVDEQLWPRALTAMRGIIGGTGATFEVIDKRRFAPTAFHSIGIPPVGEIEYADHYFAINPRVRAGLMTPAGHVHWDYQVLNEAAMQRDPFYAEFLPQIDLRYSVAGTIRQTEDEFAVFAIQRSQKQGHVGGTEIALMRRLLPHVQQAFDVAQRLKHAGETRHSLERALDWLADGVMLVRANGAVAYANEAMQAMARRGDGIAIKKGLVEFAAAEARNRFSAALAGLRQRRERNAEAVAGADFSVARGGDRPAYLVAIRPLPVERGAAKVDADAIVFVRDPMSRNVTALRMLRDVLDLTDAEAAVAQALQAGQRLEDYARTRMVSIHTVYAHLRSIKDKTGCRRMGELIRKLNDLQVPLRLD